MRLAVVIGCLAVFTSTALSATWYIKPDGTGDAPTIQSGVNMASSGDTVLVADGTYTEPMINTGYYGNSMIVMKPGLVLRSESDSASTTLLSNGDGRVVYLENCGSETVVEGFKVVGGQGGGFGGGILCNSSSPLITGCWIYDNHAHSGGGVVAVSNSSPRVIKNRIEANSGKGGGVFCYYGGNTWVENNTIIYNEGSPGAGIFVYVNASAVIKGNRIVENTSTGTSGLSAHLSNLEVYDNLFAGNYSPGQTISLSEGADVIFQRNTIVFNESPRILSVRIYHSAPDVAFSRNVVSNNTGAGVYYESGYLSLGCNNVWGNTEGDYVGIESTPSDFSLDPLFCDAPAGDFTLMSTSPCLTGNHPGGYSCELIGAFGEGCSGPSAVEKTSWGSVKAMFR